MTFTDRRSAGKKLAHELNKYSDRSDVVTVAIPRGGVVVGFEIAQALHVPLDIVVTKKIGAPGNPEYAIGSVDASGHASLNEEVLRSLGISPEGLEEEVQRLRLFIAEKTKLLRGTLPAIDVTDKHVLLVDDGIATGATMHAAVQSLRSLGVASIVVAVPVGSEDAVRSLEPLVDELHVLFVPEFFQAVGQFYDDFSEVSDAEVHQLLEQIQQDARHNE